MSRGDERERQSSLGVSWLSFLPRLVEGGQGYVGVYLMERSKGYVGVYLMKGAKVK